MTIKVFLEISFEKNGVDVGGRADCTHCPNGYYFAVKGVLNIDKSMIYEPAKEARI
jgi:hypothetical protein